jgi:hypothetical protein
MATIHLAPRPEDSIQNLDFLSRVFYLLHVYYFALLKSVISIYILTISFTFLQGIGRASHESSFLIFPSLGY